MFLFFFNDTATTEIYTLSLHDALPICCGTPKGGGFPCSGRGGSERDLPVDSRRGTAGHQGQPRPSAEDRKSTRLNSSHSQISYAVFCLKKKKRKVKKCYELD